MYTYLAKQLLWLFLDYWIKYYFIKLETVVLYFSGKKNLSFQHCVPIVFDFTIKATRSGDSPHRLGHFYADLHTQMLCHHLFFKLLFKGYFYPKATQWLSQTDPGLFANLITLLPSYENNGLSDKNVTFYLCHMLFPEF